MDQYEPSIENRKFGDYLRRVREDRRLSLEAVEEMTVGFPGRVTKSHLSRIENGQAVPTFPRMFALSQIYGVPISSLAERFEMDLRAAIAVPNVAERDTNSLMDEMHTLLVGGRYPEALMLCEALIERQPRMRDPWHRPTDGARLEGLVLVAELQLIGIECLLRLGRYGLAKEKCEELLNWSDLTPEQRLKALHHFVVSSFRLRRFEVALMGLEQGEREIESFRAKEAAIPERLSADFAVIRGNIYNSLGRWSEAIEAHHRALKIFEKLNIGFEVCRTRINLTSHMIELGQVESARGMLRRALEEAEQGGYDRQAALALSNLGLIAYRAGDLAASESYCIRSNSIARPREYLSVVFRNCYYLWQISCQLGNDAAARTHERALKSYLGRLEQPLPESESFRAHIAGGKR